MPRYEYQFGVYVDADTKEDAWEEVREISQALDKIDAEGTSVVEGPFLVSTSEALPDS